LANSPEKRSGVDAVAVLMFSNTTKKVQPLLLCFAVSALIACPAAFLPRWAAVTCVVFATVTNVLILIAERRLAAKSRELAEEAARRSAELRDLHAAIQLAAKAAPEVNEYSLREN
jgi:membrane protein implicated in regulation of membrane protease activity